MRWAAYVDCMEGCKMYTLLVRNLEVNRLLGRLKRGWSDSIKMILKRRK
jgi:hypothetical protein